MSTEIHVITAMFVITVMHVIPLISVMHTITVLNTCNSKTSQKKKKHPFLITALIYLLFKMPSNY